MIVKIKTDNGQMRVNMAEFFPNGIAKVRRLFKLMRSGTEPEELDEVRSFLQSRGDEAGRVKEASQENIERLEAELEEIESGVKELADRKQAVKQKIREEESRGRVARQVEDMTPAWLREFDYICGGYGK